MLPFCTLNIRFALLFLKIFSYYPLDLIPLDFHFLHKKAAVPYEVGNCGFCVDVRYLGCGQVSTGPNGPMGAISDLAKSGLNTGRAYHIRSSLDSCGFLHRYFSAKCPHSSKKLARCCVASIISRKVKRFLHSE